MEHYKYSRAFVLVLALFLGHVQVNAAVKVTNNATTTAKVFAQTNGNTTTYVAGLSMDSRWFRTANGWPFNPGTPAGGLPLSPYGYTVNGSGFGIGVTNGALNAGTGALHKSAAAAAAEAMFARFPINYGSAFEAVWGFTKKMTVPLVVGSVVYEAWKELGYTVVCDTLPTTGLSCRFTKLDNVQKCNVYDAAVGQLGGANYKPLCKDSADEYLVKLKIDRPSFNVQLDSAVCNNTSPTSGGTCNYLGRNAPYRDNFTVNFQAPTNLPVDVSESEVKQKLENKADFGPSSYWPPAIKDAIENGQSIDLKDGTSGYPEPVVSVRPQGDPQTTTKTNSDNSTEQTTKLDKYTTTNNNVTHNTTTTTNNYNPTTNTTTTTTTNNTNPDPVKPQEPKDFCDNNPERVGCIDIDTPLSEIPKKTETLTYVAESLFGGGTCPQPLHWSMPQQMAQGDISYQPACDILTNYVRAIVIALAAYFAFGIIMEGLKS